jgi:hypothetical protein
MVCVTDALVYKSSKEIGWVTLIVGSSDEETIKKDYLTRAVRRLYPDKKISDFTGYEIKKVKNTRQVVGLC